MPTHPLPYLHSVNVDPGPTPVDELCPNHHLWRNGRLWWIAFTVLHDGWRQERIRRSLRTADVVEARRARDELLDQVRETTGVTLSLRLPRPTNRGRSAVVTTNKEMS